MYDLPGLWAFPFKMLPGVFAESIIGGVFGHSAFLRVKFHVEHSLLTLWALLHRLKQVQVYSIPDRFLFVENAGFVPALKAISQI